MSATTEENDTVRARAEARFKLNEQRKSDAEKVWAEVQADRVAELAKTDRLRALRLAKEAADRAAVVEAPPKPTRTTRKKRV